MKILPRSIKNRKRSNCGKRKLWRAVLWGSFSHKEFGLWEILWSSWSLLLTRPKNNPRRTGRFHLRLCTACMDRPLSFPLDRLRGVHSPLFSSVRTCSCGVGKCGLWRPVAENLALSGAENPPPPTFFCSSSHIIASFIWTNIQHFVPKISRYASNHFDLKTLFFSFFLLTRPLSGELWVFLLFLSKYFFFGRLNYWFFIHRFKPPFEFMRGCFATRFVPPPVDCAFNFSSAHLFRSAQLFRSIVSFDHSSSWPTFTFALVISLLFLAHYCFFVPFLLDVPVA